jgi:3-hydroxy acid dehydrogenase/malonic semialdehyde reductase
LPSLKYICVKEFETMNKIALITGATSGIGLETAKRFASEGISLVLCGRRLERLQTIQKELSSKVKVHILNFDIRNNEEVVAALHSLPREFSKIDILINNAGNAHGLDSIQNGFLDDWDAMIDINVKGLLYVSKVIINSMIENKSGHIINIGSIAGKEVYPNGNVYCASKYAVDALTTGMRMDLNEHGIKVGGIHPGLVETEFSEVRFKGDKEKASKVYQGIKVLQPEDLADIIYFVISRPYHVNIADLVVLPSIQASATIVHRNS